MNSKCPNCSQFHFTEVTVNEWRLTIWNVVLLFFAGIMMFGSQYKSNEDNYNNTHEEIFGLPAFLWGFIIFILYIPYLFVRRFFHNKKYKKNVMYCGNCNYQSEVE